MNTDEMLSHFQGVRETGPDRWQALCPSHADREPSLSIQKDTDRILLHCHAGCQPEAIIEALNLNMVDLFIKNRQNAPQRTIEQVYPYHDAEGHIVFETVRFKPKGFSQRQPDGNGGYIWNLKGVSPVLYRLPEVMKALANDETIFICEGEKDVDNLRTLGMTATTNPMGAGKWREDYTSTLTEANAVILPDKDAPGLKHAYQVAESLHGKAASLKVIELSGQGKDPSDWIAAGGTREALEDLAAKSPSWQQAESKSPNGWTCADLLAAEFPPPVWVVPDLLPVGLAILAGRPKLGKSRLALQLAVSVGTGGVWLDRKIERGTTLAFLLEDSPRRIQDRLHKMRAPKNAAIHFEFGLPSPLNTAEGLYSFWAMVDDAKPKLIILDTMARCFNGRVDWNDIAAVTSGLSALQSGAMERNISIMFVDHHRKGSGEFRDAVTDIVSSVSKPGVADTIMGFYRSPGKREWTLAITGRDVEEQELALTYDGMLGCWQCLGDADTMRKDSVQAEIVAALTDMAHTATTAQIAEHTGLDRGLVSRTLAELVAGGYVSRGKREGKNVPYSIL